ncbi:MAG: MFS transporter [Nitrososphaeria archaeon]
MSLERLGLTKNIMLVSVAVGTLNFGFFISTSLILLYLHDALALDSSVSGLIITIARLSAAVITLPAGAFADRFGRKYPITLGFFLGALFMLVVAMTSNPIIASISIVIVYSGVAFSGPATSALISEASIVGKTALGFGWYYAIYSMAQFVGQTLSGVVVELFGYTATFIVGAVSSTIALAMMWKYSHENRGRGKRPSVGSLLYDFKTGLTLLKDNRKLLRLTLGLSLHTLGFMLSYTFIPLFASVEQGLDIVSIGVLLSVWSISGAFFQIPFGLVTDKIGGYKILFMHVLFSSVTWCMYPFLRSFYQILALMFISGVVGAMDLPARRAILSFISEERFATSVGAMDSVTQFISSLGPLIAGLLWPYAHSSPFIVGALVNILALLLLYNYIMDDLNKRPIKLEEGRVHI